jgi:predicted  nucleic acid-binding Zn-ribbon protein
MHQDLVSIIELWRNLHQAEKLQAERVACVEARIKGLEVQAEAKTQAEAARVALDEVRTEERRVMRKLDAYRKRVRTTRTMIDEGKAPDYRLAEQQLRSCVQIVDELETEALELMESRDEAEQRHEEAQKAYEDAQRSVDTAQSHERERLPAIDAELESLDLARPPLEAALATEHRSPFRTLRARKRSAIAQLKDGACATCRYGAPSQVVNEINGHIRVHQCRNCGRFLLPEKRD